MKESSAVLLGKFQIRKTATQKLYFATWLKKHLAKFGYEVKTEAYAKNGKNLVVGDVKTAKVILGAHYDTAPNAIFPMIMIFSNWISFIISQFITVIPVFIISFLYTFLSYDALRGSNPIPLLLFLLLYAVQLMFGFANKHTANDNTSGVATLISILEELPEKDRDKVCVVFFDQEELGLIGSYKYRVYHKEHITDKPMINFDCVSDGDNLTFVMKKKFRESAYRDLLEKSAVNATQGSSKKTRFCKASTNIYMSDQLLFPMGVGVVAAKKLPLFGYYINRIHSSADTRFDAENIRMLTQTVLSFANSI